MSSEDNYLERSLQELGEPLLTYSVSPRRFWTRLIIGILLLVYGVVGNYYWWVVGPGRFNHLSFLLLFAPPGMGVSLLWLVLATRGLNILLYPTGLLRVQQNQVDSFLWEEIESIWIEADSAQAEPRFGEDGQLQLAWWEVTVPSYQIWNAALTLQRSDSNRLQLNPTLAGYGQLVTIVQQRHFEQHWPKLWQRFIAGEPIPFAGSIVSLGGIYHGKNELTWQQPAKVAIAGKQLTITRDKAWTAWVKIDLETIPNPHLLLALLEAAWRLQQDVTAAAAPLPEEPD